MPKHRITFEVTDEQLATIEELEQLTGASRSMLLRISTKLLKKAVEAQKKGGRCYVDSGDGQGQVEVWLTF